MNSTKARIQNELTVGSLVAFLLKILRLKIDDQNTVDSKAKKEKEERTQEV